MTTLSIPSRPVFIIWLAVLLIGAGCQGSGRPIVYISENYYGWVRIEYGRNGAPRLHRDSWFGNDHQPLFSESGLLQTSSELGQGNNSVELAYGTVMEWRAVPPEMIHARVTSMNITRSDGSRFEPAFEIAFIGPESVYQRHRIELERFRRTNDQYVIRTLEDLPKTGNVR